MRKKSYRLHLLGKVLSTIYILLIFLLVAFLLWRVYFSGKVPSDLKKLSPNATLAAAYEQNGGELTLYTQGQATVTRAEYNYGYFSVPRFVFIKEANQVQVVFRYNNSTLKALKKDLNLQESLPRGEEIFPVNVTVVKDLTPDDKEDNKDGSETLAETVVAPTSVRMETTLLYTYFLYTFDGVEVTPDVLTVFFDIRMEGREKPLGTLRLYHNESPNDPVKLRGSEEKALASFGK